MSVNFLDDYRAKSKSGAADLEQIAAMPKDAVEAGIAQLIRDSGLDRPVLLVANLIVWTRRQAEQMTEGDPMPAAPDALDLIVTAEGRAGMLLFWLVDGNQGPPRPAEFRAAFDLGFLGLVDLVMPKLSAIAAIGAALLVAMPETPPELDDWLSCLMKACVETTALRQLPEFRQFAAAFTPTRRSVTPDA